jgi:hypothetical protein
MSLRRLQQRAKIGCPFCWEYVPTPQRKIAVFSADGTLGGRCGGCGAAFVVDETGRSGGQALLDAQAVLCDGDLDKAMAMDSHDYEVKKRAYQGPTNSVGGRPQGHAYLQPKIWFLKLKDKA